MSEEASAEVGPSRTSRELGRGAALFVSVGAVIGSGWLFAGFDASELSGGGSILAWLIAGGLGAVLAMSYAELGATFPVDDLRPGAQPPGQTARQRQRGG